MGLQRVWHDWATELNWLKSRGFPSGTVVRVCLPMQETQETWVWFLGQEDALEKEMATCSSMPAWRIPWTEEPGGLQVMGVQRVGHDWAQSIPESRGRFPGLPSAQTSWGGACSALWHLVCAGWALPDPGAPGYKRPQSGDQRGNEKPCSYALRGGVSSPCCMVAIHSALERGARGGRLKSLSNATSVGHTAEFTVTRKQCTRKGLAEQMAWVEDLWYPGPSKGCRCRKELLTQFQKIIRRPLESLRHPAYPFWYALGQSSQDAILALGSQMDAAQDGELEVLEGSGWVTPCFLRNSQERSHQGALPQSWCFSNSLGHSWLCLVLCVWATVGCYDAEWIIISVL